MKKILSIVILLSFTLLLIVPASAEGLSNMSDEELITMYREIQSILLSRSGNYEIQLNAGRYVIG